MTLSVIMATSADGFAVTSKPRVRALKATPARTSVARFIMQHPSVAGCRINRRKEGGFVTPHGVLPGLHRIIAQAVPDNTTVVWRGKQHTRAPPHMVGLKVHAEMAALANKNKPVATKRAKALVAFLADKGWTLARAEVNVYALGFCATALDLLCTDTRTGQAVVIELKTSPKTSSQHLSTYNLACSQAPVTYTALKNTEYTRHQLQLASALYMITHTLKVPSTQVVGAVVVVTCDCQVHSYMLAPTLQKDITNVVKFLTPPSHAAAKHGSPSTSARS
jgi:hypothetical protein